VFGPSFKPVVTGVKAYVDAIDAKGGVNGHPLRYVVADDQSSTQGNLVALRDLVENKKVSAIATWDVAIDASADYLRAKRVPVLGTSFGGGPEWGLPEYANFFVIPFAVDPHYRGFTSFASWIKSKGITKLATVADDNDTLAFGSAKATRTR